MIGLEAMRAYPQWLNYILVPKPNGKVDKLPVNPRTGQVCSAHDSTMWLSYDEARAVSSQISFVFTANDPFWFLDIDDCLQPDRTWSQTALTLMSALEGAAFEVSQSGTGVHGFGVIPETLPHGCKRMDLGLEFYTEGRFCAVTEDRVVGSATYTPTPELYRWLVEQWFPAGAGGSAPTPEDWTTEPCEEWLGPDDDAVLIEKMLASKSVKSIVGAGIRFRDLWVADSEKLAVTYPDIAGGQDRLFDWSQADAALCSHLAFWTGKNCERAETLWLQSELGQRDKAQREDYRRNTILRAVSVCGKVYRDRKLIAPADPAAPPTSDGLRAGFQFLAPQDQITLFQGCAYVRDLHKVWVPDGGMLKPEQFKAAYGGFVFAVDSINDKTTRNAWEVFTESQAVGFPWVHDTCFRPERTSGEVVESEGRKSLNTYVPIQTDILQGDPAPFIDLLCRLIPVLQDREILLAYMAACVQFPGVKYQWAPVLQGTFGNGKSLLSEILTFCIGIRYTHKVNPKDIDNVFNAWITGKLLIVIDEIKTRNAEQVIETLKWLITDGRVPIQGKGEGQTTGDNRANFIMCTNYKDGVVKTWNDRRFAVFFTGQQSVEDLIRDGMTGMYFPNLVKWLKTGGYAVINNYLRLYQVPNALHPEVCVRAPETSSTEEAVLESYSPLSQEILEATRQGTPGFRGGWVSTMALNALIGSVRSKVTINQRQEVLRDLGYIKHPALPDGRATRFIPAENGRPRLYVMSGHLSLNTADASQAMQMYCEAQGFPVMGVEAGAHGQTQTPSGN